MSPNFFHHISRTIVVQRTVSRLLSSPAPSMPWVLVLAIPLISGGCHREPLTLPEVYSVTGKLTAPNGMKLEGATVEFSPIGASSEHMAKGSVDATGQFTLRMSHRRGMVNGAPAGDYSVVVYMPLGSERVGEPIDIDGQFTVEQHENRFIISLPVTR